MISWPPATVGQGLCGFNGGWSLVTKSFVKRLASSAVPEFKRKKNSKSKLVFSALYRRTRTRQTFDMLF